MSKTKPRPNPAARSSTRLRSAASPAATARGRLIFALDATASRQPAWNTARRIQSRMFEETAAIGGLEVRLCYFRGQREFIAGPWLADSAQLLSSMDAVFAIGGRQALEAYGQRHGRSVQQLTQQLSLAHDKG
ncbi:MAG: hypothetical protein ACREVE_00290 [Gammaproteobacteria bacterium]